MPPFYRRMVWRPLALSFLFATACTSGATSDGLPTTVAPAAVASVAPMATPPLTPATPTTTSATLSLTVVYPQGSFSKLQGSLRTQSAVPASDLTDADLQRLAISLNGHRLNADQYTFTGLSYDRGSNLVVTLKVHGVADCRGTVRIASPGDAFVLLAPLNPAACSDSGTVTVDSQSTAAALLDQALAGKTVSDTDRQNLLTIVARRVHNLLTSTSDGNVETSPSLGGLLNRIGMAVSQQQPLDTGTLSQIETPPSKGGGGGTVAAAPTITGLNPTSGSFPQTVIITGTNLTGATAVNFGMTAATFTVDSPTQITAQMPTLAGFLTVQVTVTTAGGTSNSIEFTNDDC